MRWLSREGNAGRRKNWTHREKPSHCNERCSALKLKKTIADKVIKISLKYLEFTAERSNKTNRRWLTGFKGQIQNSNRPNSDNS